MSKKEKMQRSTLTHSLEPVESQGFDDEDSIRNEEETAMNKITEGEQSKPDGNIENLIGSINKEEITSDSQINEVSGTTDDNDQRVRVQLPENALYDHNAKQVVAFDCRVGVILNGVEFNPEQIVQRIWDSIERKRLEGINEPPRIIQWKNKREVEKPKLIIIPDVPKQVSKPVVTHKPGAAISAIGRQFGMMI